LTFIDFHTDRQNLGTILENKVVQKLKFSKNDNNKKPSSTDRAAGMYEDMRTGPHHVFRIIGDQSVSVYFSIRKQNLQKSYLIMDEAKN
jgi:hypothetical protein